jgi:hypothetical protein
MQCTGISVFCCLMPQMSAAQNESKLSIVIAWLVGGSCCSEEGLSEGLVTRRPACDDGAARRCRACDGGGPLALHGPCLQGVPGAGSPADYPIDPHSFLKRPSCSRRNHVLWCRTCHFCSSCCIFQRLLLFAAPYSGMSCGLHEGVRSGGLTVGFNGCVFHSGGE